MEKIQKKISINKRHEDFLKNYKRLGYNDQGSIVREALDKFITEHKKRERKSKLKTQAEKLRTIYLKNKKLTEMTTLDNEEFYETR